MDKCKVDLLEHQQTKKEYKKNLLRLIKGIDIGELMLEQEELSLKIEQLLYYIEHEEFDNEYYETDY